MISKNKIKFLQSLSLKKNREKYQQVILEGYRLIEEVARANIAIEDIYCTSEMMNIINHNHLLKSNNKIVISDKECRLISETQNSQGIIALVSIEKYLQDNINSIKNKNAVILDGVSDPGNLGTIFRNCIWFGINSIILTDNSIDPFNLKSIRSGMGAHFYFENIVKTSSKKIIQHLKKYNFNTFIADLSGEDMQNVNYQENWALVLGSEAHGISDSFKEFQKVTINKFGSIESLNVSVASGILLNEITKNNL
tara:strand:+ start:2438 stop:3196 length:759 start_codon:yes stop_codon:yes gene_type:complete